MSTLKYLLQKVARSILKKNMQPGRPFIVAVEGNIGSGKSTFLEYFNNFEGVEVLSEPVESWRNLNGNNLLGLMYEDPKKWSFTFQSYVQLTMLQNHLKPTKASIKLMERSIFSARYCFVEKMKRDRILPHSSAAVLDAWFQWITNSMNINIDLIVYLRTSPEIVYQRIMERNRPEEKLVSLEYIQSLHEIHEDWLNNKCLHHCPAPVLIINADLDKAIIQREYQHWKSAILNEKPSTIQIL
ncbi:deoxynucleoside kinase-like [Rhynchophorus ferrugineus]|uniref:Deoxynucleoside kinase domain-containing protein n=1 Tax=Rhynchophorus ferrugineus TaxID=354439 RepID=A0A834MG37_RHYFE|nr:hypothetical protein GWI33_001987 [Rhynchophorus ferrugineus]